MRGPDDCSEQSTALHCSRLIHIRHQVDHLWHKALVEEVKLVVIIGQLRSVATSPAKHSHPINDESETYNSEGDITLRGCALPSHTRW